jgi:hypothetical protein
MKADETKTSIRFQHDSSGRASCNPLQGSVSADSALVVPQVVR